MSSLCVVFQLLYPPPTVTFTPTTPYRIVLFVGLLEFAFEFVLNARKYFEIYYLHKIYEPVEYADECTVVAL